MGSIYFFYFYHKLLHITLSQPWWFGIILGIATFFTGYFSNENKIDLAFTKFAAGSVGIADDKLNFKKTAEHTAKGISGLKNYINVARIYGILGSGKSSYIRMVIEYLDNNSTLYTYISLTETNEAKDFSSLFAERWLETLRKCILRLILLPIYLYVFNSVENGGHGIYSEILNFELLLKKDSLNRSLFS